MRKLVAALVACSLLLTPVGSVVFNGDVSTVEAKGYKSGKRSFNMDRSKTNPDSGIQQKQDRSNMKDKSSANNRKGGFASGGLMKGLMLGGLAGLFFGGLLANMGALGPIIGMMINIMAIMLVISLIRSFFLNKRRKEESRQWGN